MKPTLRALGLSFALSACASQSQVTTRTALTVAQPGAVATPTRVVTLAGVAQPTLQGAPMQSRVLVDADGNTWMGLWIDTPTLGSVATARAPLDVALVIDTSGSMSGDKIENARLAARSFIDGLSDGDIVSLYAFSDSVRELAGPTPVTASTRAALLDAVGRLYASGGTNLYDGLRVGQAATDRAPPTHPVRRIVVISDGRANIGPSSAGEFGDLAARSTENGTQMTAIGVGLDYDENTLGALAVRSAGRLYHLEQPEQMGVILHDELQLLGQTVASNTAIELVPAAGVVIEGTDTLRVDRQPDGHVRIPVGSLYAGQHRELLLRVRYAPQRAPSGGTLATARLTYDDPGAPTEHRAQADIPMQFEVTRDSELARQSTNQRVQAMVLQYETAQSQLRAVQMLNEGRAAAAEAELQRAEENLRAQARQYNFTDEVVQGNLTRQATQLSSGRAAARRAVAAPSAARGAALQNSAGAMHDLGF